MSPGSACPPSRAARRWKPGTRHLLPSHRQTAIYMTSPNRALILFAAGVVAVTAMTAHGIDAQSRNAPLSNEWPTYGHDPDGHRFSPLTELTPANVSQLQVAWVYHMRPA